RRVELLHRLDAFHELRELLELRPLVVHRGHRRLDLDRSLERARPITPADTKPAEAGHQPRARLRNDDRYHTGRAREQEDRVAQSVAALLLHSRRRAAEVTRHPTRIRAKLPVGGEPGRGSDYPTAVTARTPARP